MAARSARAAAGDAGDRVSQQRVSAGDEHPDKVCGFPDAVEIVAINPTTSLLRWSLPTARSMVIPGRSETSSIENGIVP